MLLTKCCCFQILYFNIILFVQGWKGSNCENPCDPGIYGQDCKSSCTCQNGAKCNPIDGECTCLPGYKGKR